MNDFLQLKEKQFLIFGVANKKSVAYFITRNLLECGARCVLVVLNEEIREKIQKLFPEISPEDIHLCNVEHSEDILRLRDECLEQYPNTKFHGLVHSLAFADYSRGMLPFHETGEKEFLQAVNISCFSLTALAGAFKDLLARDASVVTISISTTHMASESYGYMGPIKAALDSSLAFLAKSFSEFSEIRFNAVGPGLLKTSASAGIPGYVDSYLYAEEVIPRGRAVKTEEAANTAIFLLSPRSSGINAQKIIVDAGMSINYFDRKLIHREPFHEKS
ncbi:MAG: SDR family oxidoreductase [Planctomycetia bacterium]|nr:SDR family oxidoreductase [Planctomycetia bacterium]